VQVGITLVGILIRRLGGATLAGTLPRSSPAFPCLEPYANVIALVVVVLLITYFSLVVGELVPKRLAMNNPEGIAILVARPMNVPLTPYQPGGNLLKQVNRPGFAPIGWHAGFRDPPITEEELIGLAGTGHPGGRIR
jgi:putative hemolysin